MKEKKREYQIRLNKSQLISLREIAFLNNCIYIRSKIGCVPQLVENIVNEKVTILIKDTAKLERKEEIKRYNLRITNTCLIGLREIAKEYGYCYRNEGSIPKFLKAIANKEIILKKKGNHA